MDKIELSFFHKNLNKLKENKFFSTWIIRILIKAKMEEGVEHYLPNYMTKYIAVDNILYKKILSRCGCLDE